MTKTIIGIIGRISSGKTLAGSLLGKMGAGFIDCDEVVKGLYKEGNMGARKIETFFGPEFLRKGSVDKAKLGKFVSKDIKKLHILEKIIHPITLSEVQKLIDKSQKKLIFLEMGAMNKDFLALCKKIILIKAPEKIRKQKIKTEYLKKIDDFQVLPKGDIIVKNDYNRKNLENKLRKIYTGLLKSKS